MQDDNLDEAIARVKQYSESHDVKQSLENYQNQLNEKTKKTYEAQQLSAEDMRHKFTV